MGLFGSLKKLGKKIGHAASKTAHAVEHESEKVAGTALDKAGLHKLRGSFDKVLKTDFDMIEHPGRYVSKGVDGAEIGGKALGKGALKVGKGGLKLGKKGFNVAKDAAGAAGHLAKGAANTAESLGKGLGEIGGDLKALLNPTVLIVGAAVVVGAYIYVNKGSAGAAAGRAALYGRNMRSLGML
jgi:hypothetical protein